MNSVPAPPPSTADYLRFHARHRPKAIAVIDNGREIDFATFQRDLGRFTRAVREFGPLPRGSIVAVAWESFYPHWLLLLACENLGYATASFRPEEGAALAPLLARAHLVLSRPQLLRVDEKKRRLLTQDWLDGAFGSPDVLDEPIEPMTLDEPQRIRRSSGTTGGLKMMIGTRGIEEQWVQNHTLAHGFTPQSRLLLTTPFTVGSMFSRATACLRLGAACIGDDRISEAKSIERYRPTHVRLFQFQMKSLLDSLKGISKPVDLTVMVGAAPLSAVLRRRLLEELASRITYTYSSNESGSIAMVDEAGVCTLRPGVAAEVVDDDGNPVPHGQIGRIRIRTRSLVDGYLDNPEATARSFGNGWFHSGDAGMMLEPGRMKLMGRADDLLNIAGRKVEPRSIEEMVARTFPVRDVAATSIGEAEGVEELCIALVVNEAARAAEHRSRVLERFTKRYGNTHVRVVDAIPRTAETGKIRRAELKKLFQGK